MRKSSEIHQKVIRKSWALLLKAEEVRTRVCAIFLRICAKFYVLNAKQEKQAHFFMIFAKYDKISLKCYAFLWHLRHVPLRKIFSQKIWLGKRIRF